MQGRGYRWKETAVSSIKSAMYTPTSPDVEDKPGGKCHVPDKPPLEPLSERDSRATCAPQPAAQLQKRKRGKPVGTKGNPQVRRQLREARAEIEREAKLAKSLLMQDPASRMKEARKSLKRKRELHRAQASELPKLDTVQPFVSKAIPLVVLDKLAMELHRLCNSKTDDKDECPKLYSAILSHHMTRRKRELRFKSLKFLAEDAGVDGRTYHEAMETVHGLLSKGVRLATAGMCAEVAKRVQNESVDAELLLEAFASDETPHAVRFARDSDDSNSDSASGKEGGKSQQLVHSADVAPPPGKRQKHTEAQDVKTQQSELLIGMLVKDKATQQRTFVTAEVATWLQAVDHSTAENIHTAYVEQRHVPGLSSLAEKFTMRVRFGVADMAGSNIRCEKACRREEKSSPSKSCHWSRIAQPCRIHRVQTSKGKVLGTVGGDISGLIALSSQQRSGGSMRKLRRMLGCLLVQRCNGRIEGPPPDSSTDASRHWQSILDAAFANRASRHNDAVRQSKPYLTGTSATLKKRRAILERYIYPVGRKRFVHHCAGKACCRSDRDFKHKLKKKVVRAFLPSAIPCFSRHKWQGVLDSYAESVLLFQSLDLGRSLIPKWNQARKAVAKTIERIAAEETDSDTEKSDDDEGFLGDGEDNDSGAESQDELKLMQEAPNGTAYWEVRNRREKRQCNTMASRGPGGRLSVTWRCVVPISKLMNGYVGMSGEAYEKKEFAKLAKNEGRVQFRAFHACNATLEEDCARAIRQVAADEEWTILRPKQKRQELESLSFRQLSGSICAVFMLLYMPSRAFPLRILEVLQLPKQKRLSWARLVHRWPQCLLDDFTRDLLKEFPTAEALVSARALATLHCIASLWAIDIARIEKRHSDTLRQLQHLAGLTHKKRFTDAGCIFTLRRQGEIERSRILPSLRDAAFIEATGESERKRPGPTKNLEKNRGTRRAFKPRVRRADKKKITRYGGWGAARAYMHLQSAGGHLRGLRGAEVFKKVNASYKAVEGADKDELKETGQRLTEQRKTTPVGTPVQAMVTRHALPDGVAAAVARLRGEPELESLAESQFESAAMVVPQQLPPPVSVQLVPCAESASMQEIVQHRRAEFEREKREQEQIEGALVAFQEQHRDSVVFSTFQKTAVAEDFEALPLVQTVGGDGEVVDVQMLRFKPDMSRFIEKFFAVAGRPARAHDAQGASRPGVHAMLRGFCQQSHRLYKHSMQPQLGKLKGTAAMNSRCRAFGVHVCFDGKMMAFISRMESALRIWCKKPSTFKPFFDQLRVVLRCRVGRELLWLHPGYINALSMASGMMLLDENTDPQAVASARIHASIPLIMKKVIEDNEDPLATTTGDQFWREMGLVNMGQFAAWKVDLNRKVFLQAYVIVGGRRRLVHGLKGARCMVKQLSEEIEIWQGNRTQSDRLVPDKCDDDADICNASASDNDSNPEGDGNADGGLDNENVPFLFPLTVSVLRTFIQTIRQETGHRT